MKWAEQLEILRELSSENSKYKLLYVTPEKVAKWVNIFLVVDSENVGIKEIPSRIRVEQMKTLET